MIPFLVYFLAATRIFASQSPVRDVEVVPQLQRAQGLLQWLWGPSRWALLGLLATGCFLRAPH